MSRQVLQEGDILEALRAGEIELSPLTLDLAGVEPGPAWNGRRGRLSAYVDVRWKDRTFRFVARLVVQATPKAFRDAVEQVRAQAEAREMRPMVVTSYLAPDRIHELESWGVSGLDLCGNGVVVIPDEVLVVRTGNPNQYPARRGIRNVYRGASSLVARVFLVRPRYETVQGVQNEITNRGGRVSLGTVSKALKALEEDLVIRRDGRTSELLHADELLDRLGSRYRPPRVGARKTYRWGGAPGELMASLRAGKRPLVLTGLASVEHYSIMPREKTAQFYCGAIEPIVRGLRGQLEESRRFPDLELVETGDPTVTFDSRSTDTVPVASPVQCWLELQAGDKRHQDASVAVRERIFEELRDSGWSPR